ncbi:MAG: S9 family peptidase [Gemmatimonadetes bacterium]|nr:S9 family peptidase [Gemmatimonadota bacterium]
MPRFSRHPRFEALSSSKLFLGAVFLLTAVLPPASLVAQEKPPITVDDYGQWKRITSTSLSPNGAWMSYAYDRLEGEDTLHIANLDGGGSLVVPRGSAPAFSRDSRWVAYQLSPPEQDRGDGNVGPSSPQRPAPGRRPGQGEGGNQGRIMVLKNLASGDSLTFADVASFSFPDNTEVLLIRKRGGGDGADFAGADLVIHHPGQSTSLNLGNVSDFAVNEPGTHLAYLVDAADDAGNGLYLLELASNRIQALDTDAATYAELTWNESGDGLAALRGNVPDDRVQRENVLLIVRDLDQPHPIAVLDMNEAQGFPEGYVLSELAGLNWSEDSERIFVGIKEQTDEREELDDRGNVDVHHWADVQPQSVQEVRANRERNRTWASVVNLGGNLPSFVRLADETMEAVTPAGTSQWGIGRDPTPYQYEVSWGGSKADYFRVSLDTGEREPLAEGLGRQMGASDDGAWWLYLKNEEVIARRLASGEEVNLTESSGVDFVNRQDDHPYELPTYGVAGWTTDGEGVVLYDRYDVWEVPLDGTEAVNLTQGMGAAGQIRFRVTRINGGGFGGFGGGSGDDEGIDLDEPLFLSAYGDRTKKSGYFEVEAGREPRPLIWLDKSAGRPIKADDTDRVIFTQQTFVEFPDYWVSDTRFRNPRKVTNANPQQAEFAWSPGRVLIDYVDERGNELQGTLGLPAGYEEGKKYPMLVYFYELSSQRHHSYQGPAYDDRPHMATYASNGYLVFQPDIVYTIGKPGSSALDDLTSSINKVIELGYADPDRIGLQGHSWGGYQSSFAVTQTDMFAAVVTGAPPTNLISFYNTLYRSSGNIQQGISEVGQVRMGTTPFEDFELYLSQSPIHHTEKITTPFMILHGTVDGSVDYGQGLEYYAMARRMGKEVILLSYPEEGHHLSRKENRIDFQIRMMQYFDHYLKGTQKAKWMVEGVPFLEKEYANPREMMDGSIWGKVTDEEEEKGSGQGKGGAPPSG